MRFSLEFLSLIALAVIAQDTNIQTVEQAFDNANVGNPVTSTFTMFLPISLAQIPEDLSITFNPNALLGVTFPEPGADPITIHAGQQLPRDCMFCFTLVRIISTKKQVVQQPLVPRLSP